MIYCRTLLDCPYKLDTANICHYENECENKVYDSDEIAKLIDDVTEDIEEEAGEEYDFTEVITKVYEQGVLMGEVGIMKCVQIAIDNGATFEDIQNWVENQLAEDRYQEVLDIFGMLEN